MNEKVNNGNNGIIPQPQAGSKPKIPRWAMTPYPGPWQVVRLSVSDDGKKRMPIETQTVVANYATTAYMRASVLYPDCKPGLDIVAYPLATLTDGGGVDRLARYVAKRYQKWQIRNQNAIFQGLSAQDREDQAQQAALAIWEGLLSDSIDNMYDLYKIGFNAICAERDKLYRISEQSWDPDRLPSPFRQIVAKNGPLGELFAEAAKKAANDGKITENQLGVVELYGSGTRVVDIADLRGIKRDRVYKLLYRGLYHILSAMIDIDIITGDNTFSRYDITPQDISDVLDNLLRKSGKKAKK